MPGRRPVLKPGNRKKSGNYFYSKSASILCRPALILFLTENDRFRVEKPEVQVRFNVL